MTTRMLLKRCCKNCVYYIFKDSFSNYFFCKDNLHIVSRRLEKIKYCVHFILDEYEN